MSSVEVLEAISMMQNRDEKEALKGFRKFDRALAHMGFKSYYDILNLDALGIRVPLNCLTQYKWIYDLKDSEEFIRESLFSYIVRSESSNSDFDSTFLRRMLNRLDDGQELTYRQTKAVLDCVNRLYGKVWS